MSQNVRNQPLIKTGLRRMARRPVQYVLFVLGVALGVAMMVSIDLANGSSRRAFQLSTDAVAGKTTHRVVGASGSLDESLYVELKTGLGYDQAAPVVEGYVKIPQLGDQPMRLVGVDPFAEPPFRDYLQPGDGANAGSLGPFLLQPNAVVLSQALAEENGLALGDLVTLNVSGVPVEAPIVGLIEAADDVTARGLQSLLFTDISSAQSLFDMGGHLSHIDLIAAGESDLAPIAAMLPAEVRIEPAAASGNALQQMIAAFELNLTALSLLALVVGMFLIYNTVTFSVVQRRKLFGILRSLGVTGGQLFGLILAEAALLSLLGSLIGVGLGVILGRFMVGLVTQTINDLYFVVNVQQVSVPAITLVKGVIIGVGAALLASLAPAWEAMRTTPNTSLRRSSLESKTERLVPWLVPVWAVMVLVGGFLLWWQAAGLAVNFVGLLTVLIAFALLCPPVTLWLMRWLAPLGGRLLGPLGRMAPRDIARSLSRTSVAIAALMTAVSVIIGVSIMIGSFRGTVVTWLNAILQADIYVSPPALTGSRVVGFVDPAVLERLDDYPNVEQVVKGRDVMVYSPSLERDIELVAPSGDVSAGERPYRWINGDEAALWERFEAGEGVILSDPLVQREGLTIPPEPITLMTASGPQSFPVLGIYLDYSTDQGAILIHHDLYAPLWQDEAINSVGLFLTPDAPVDEMVAQLQAELNPIQPLDIRSNQGLREASLVIFDRTFAVTAALRLLATVVAFIGVLSALLSLQLERQRELGVLRATGMTVGQLWRLTLLETGLMGALAGLLAMPTGFVLAWILIYVINVRSFGWVLQMQLNPTYFLQALLVAVLAALLAGVYPSLRLGKMVIATAIRQE